jgi:hypothetical protein
MMPPLSMLGLVIIFVALSEYGLSGFWIGFVLVWISATPLFLLVILGQQGHSRSELSRSAKDSYSAGDEPPMAGSTIAGRASPAEVRRISRQLGSALHSGRRSLQPILRDELSENPDRGCATAPEASHASR